MSRTKPPCRYPPDPSSDRGAALVLVLWFTVAISLIAAAVARLGQSDLKVALNLAGAAQAQAMAEGGIYLAAAALSRNQAVDPWPIDGRMRELELGSGRVQIRIRDEAAKTNPSTASVEELNRIFIESGIEPARAAELAGELVRQRDSVARARVVAEVRSTASRNSPFLTLADAGRAAGMSADEFAQVRKRLSLYAQSRVAAQLAERNDPLPRARRQPAPADRDLVMQPRSRADLYEIAAVAITDTGARAEHRAVMRISSAGGGRLQVLDWE